ncbi:response regulator [Zooshikella ganghwensis]|uniref:response regulator n=1 Tax=Zooshikella ganghwensis TaxID=202772 RepID=UPI0004247841|nr:response regulator [Zooshikella ganghwensis]
MHKNKKILVVDDDTEIRTLLREYLERSGFSVLEAADGVSLFEQFPAEDIDIVLLDVMLPGDDGFTLCQKIRKESLVPIIMLTASSDDADRIVGLEMGADDYMAKPFNPRELLARIKAILRRVETHQQPVEVRPAANPRYYKFAGWTLDTTSRQLVREGEQQYPLTGADFALLMLFLEHPQRILKRDEISDLTRGRESSPFDRSIDVHVSRLRHRLGDDGKNPQIIKTVRGAGYVLAVEVSVADELD